jgi:hypothetical protein
MTSVLRRLDSVLRPARAATAPLDGWVVCGGDSMTPTVRFGQRVRVVPCERIRAGDVVVLRSGSSDAHVLHRVVLKVPGLPWFVHAGDSPSCRGLSLASTDQVVGCADLPRRRPSIWLALRGVKRVASAAWHVVWWTR